MKPLLLLLALSLAACSASTPQEAVANYGDAVASDDAEAAYALLAPELRERMDFQAFEAAWKDRRQGLLPLAEDLKNAPQRKARVSANLPYNDYDTLKLRLGDEGWRITGGVLDVYSQDSPQKALITFVRAVERQRFDILLRLAPSQYARHMTPESLREDFEARKEEIGALVAELKVNLNNPIELRDDRAFLNYGRRQVTFVLEGNAWKIEDPD